MESKRRVSASDYEPPSFSDATKHAERSTSIYDSLILPTGPKFFRARKNNNTIRILPPTWASPTRHYSYEVKVHSDVGAQKQQYLCLAQNEMSPDKHCPLCEERNAPGISYDDREKLRAKARNYIYLIDRFNEDSGPLLWSISTQSDKEILIQSLIKRTQEYLPIASVNKGYDVDFMRDGEGLATRYRGFQVSRESTPLSSNPNQVRRWVEYIEDNPIPEMLQFFPAEHIMAVYGGQVDPSSNRRSSRDDDERPAPRSRAREDAREDTRNGRDDDNVEEGADNPPWEEEGGGNGDRRERLRTRLDNTRR